MSSIRYLAGAALVFVPVIALAQSPFEISGLHMELDFTEAVAKAEKLGGTCQITTSRTQDGGKIAQCGYLPCIEHNLAGECEKWDLDAPKLTIAAQPIMQIGLEAPGDISRLTRILILFEGSTVAVAESLEREFGPPKIHGNSQGKSWTHSRRMSWTQGNYHMGLMDSPKLISLTVDRAQ